MDVQVSFLGCSHSKHIAEHQASLGKNKTQQPQKGQKLGAAAFRLRPGHDRMTLVWQNDTLGW